MRTFSSRFKKYVTHINVKDYGAKLDDIQDDHDAVQLAINAALASNASPACLFFPAGICKIGSPLTVPLGTIGLEIKGIAKRLPYMGGGAHGSMIRYTAIGDSPLFPIMNSMQLYIHDIGFAGTGINDSQRAFLFTQAGVGTGMSTFSRVGFQDLGVATQYADNVNMSGCADIGYDFCEFIYCDIGVKTLNNDGANYSFNRLYANWCPQVISSLPGLYQIRNAQIVGCGTDTRHAFDWYGAGNNNGWVLFEGGHFEGACKSLFRMQGGRLHCKGLEEATYASGTTHFYLYACQAEIEHSRFVSGTPSVPLIYLQGGSSSRTRVDLRHVYFDRAIDSDTYKSIVGMDTDASFALAYGLEKCLASSSGVPYPIVDMGGRVQDCKVGLLCRTTNNTPTEMTTTGAAGAGNIRIDNQYNYRLMHITILGISNGNYCRFIRDVVFTTNGISDIQTVGTDIDTITGCSVSLYSPDLNGLRIAVTGPAVATCDWQAVALITSPGLQ